MEFDESTINFMPGKYVKNNIDIIFDEEKHLLVFYGLRMFYRAALLLISRTLNQCFFKIPRLQKKSLLI